MNKKTKNFQGLSIIIKNIIFKLNKNLIMDILIINNKLIELNLKKLI